MIARTHRASTAWSGPNDLPGLRSLARTYAARRKDDRYVETWRGFKKVIAEGRTRHRRLDEHGDGLGGPP
jgi:hypothetical protein